jgi:hypothetical protein
VLVVITLVATAAFVYRPAAILGVGDRALADSVAEEAGGSGALDECSKRGGGHWRCSVSEGSGKTARYDVQEQERGCWTARRVGGPGGLDRAPTRTSGCIGVLDYVHVAD